MKKVALLSMESLEGFIHDDDTLLEPLKALGIEAGLVPWSVLDTDWGSFDAVIVRSPYDYIEAPEEFARVLSEIEASGAVLANARSTILWNMNKAYLSALQDAGVPLIPTVFGEKTDAATLRGLYARFGTDELIVKPLVGCGGVGVHRLPVSVPDEKLAEVAGECDGFMAQPFVPAILTEGEISLIFIEGAFSHAVKKVPASGHFLVQEEHGGTIVGHGVGAEEISCGTKALEAAAKCLGIAPKDVLYARADMVRLESGGYGLMELELIEPSLFLDRAEGAPERLARAIAALIG